MKNYFRLTFSNFVKIIMIFVIISFVFIYTFYKSKQSNFNSKDLKDKNLKGFVKKVTSNQVLFQNNLELYNFNGNLQMWTSSTYSVQVSFDNSGKKSLILQNYFVCEQEFKKLDIENYKYFFKSKKSVLQNTTDINLREDKEYENFDISEEDFLYIKLLNSSGKVIKSYLVNEKFDLSDCYDYKYYNNIKKVYNCGDTKPISIIKYDSFEKKIEAYSYDYNDKNYKTDYIYNNGLNVKSKTYDIDNICWSFTNTKYNSNNDEVSISTFNDSEKSKYFGSGLELNLKINYIYDENNNWIEKTEVFGKNNTRTSKRKIEYYGFFDYLNNLFTIN
jgi:hypothetical protein